MNPKEFKFVLAMCGDSEDGPITQTEAARIAGYCEENASSIGSDLAKRPYIKAAIEEHRANVAIRAEITQEAVLRRWWEIANADANDLIQVRRVNCRHCRGVSHWYQWTPSEYLAAVDEAIAKKLPAPDGLGGFGFDLNAPPVPDCPECKGNGVEVLHLADTRTLTGRAKRLYAGVQKTKDGIKIITRDQDAALANVAKYLGMLVERKEVSGPGGKPIDLRTSKAEELTDEQLAAIIKASNAQSS